MDGDRSGILPAGPGVGIGLCDVDRIARLYERHGDRFLRTCFSDDEIEYCLAAARPAVHLAGRWAAKRALRSALRSFDLKAPDREISVVAEEGGAPRFHLPPGLQQGLPRDLSGRLSLSLSHTARTAVAVVILGGPS
jgi:holo-[acyl-carrier protein] synthase